MIRVVIYQKEFYYVISYYNSSFLLLADHVFFIFSVEISRTTRHLPPAHYSLRVKTYSLLSETEKYESGVFEAGGFKWFENILILNLLIMPVNHH